MDRELPWRQFASNELVYLNENRLSDFSTEAAKYSKQAAAAYDLPPEKVDELIDGLCCAGNHYQFGLELNDRIKHGKDFSQQLTKSAREKRRQTRQKVQPISGLPPKEILEEQARAALAVAGRNPSGTRRIKSRGRGGYQKNEAMHTVNKVMASVWRYLGRDPGTAYIKPATEQVHIEGRVYHQETRAGAAGVSAFEEFCWGWCKVIDPTFIAPDRQVTRDAQK